MLHTILALAPNGAITEGDVFVTGSALPGQSLCLIAPDFEAIIDADSAADFLAREEVTAWTRFHPSQSDFTRMRVCLA